MYKSLTVDSLLTWRIEKKTNEILVDRLFTFYLDMSESILYLHHNGTCGIEIDKLCKQSKPVEKRDCDTNDCKFHIRQIFDK